VRGAVSRCRSAASRARVAVVADPLDRRPQRTRTPRTRVAQLAVEPSAAQLCREPADRVVVVALGRAHPRVADPARVPSPWGVVARLAGRWHASVVSTEHPDDVVVDPGVDGAGGRRPAIAPGAARDRGRKGAPYGRVEIRGPSVARLRRITAGGPATAIAWTSCRRLRRRRDSAPRARELRRRSYSKSGDQAWQTINLREASLRRRDVPREYRAGRARVTSRRAGGISL
jgi:hypothetical protein